MACCLFPFFTRSLFPQVEVLQSEQELSHQQTSVGADFRSLFPQVEVLQSEQELSHQQTSVGADLSRPSPIYRHRTTPEDAFQVWLSTDLDQNGPLQRSALVVPAFLPPLDVYTDRGCSGPGL